MVAMLAQADSFNQDVSNFNTSAVTDMSHMFEKSAIFDGNVAGWDVSRVKSMASMFLGAVAFQGHDLDKWQISSGTSFSSMFEGAESFATSLCSWGPLMHKNASVSRMFYNSGCPDERDPDLTADPPGPFCFPCE